MVLSDGREVYLCDLRDKKVHVLTTCRTIDAMNTIFLECTATVKETYEELEMLLVNFTQFKSELTPEMEQYFTSAGIWVRSDEILSAELVEEG